MKKPSRSKLVKKLDEVFSVFIRKKYADSNGLVKCFTCSKVAHWKEMQCGHFQSRRHYATRWDEGNTRPQCVGCNLFKQGEQYTFGINLDKEGVGFAESMRLKSQTTVKFTNSELLEMIEKYK
jgi:hypothetical protein